MHQSMWRRGFTMAAVAVVGLSTLGASGCASLAKQAFANPVVEVKNVVVKGVGTQGGSLDVILDVYNPNEYRMDATKLSYTVWVDTNHVALGEIEKLVTLKDKGHSEVVVPVEFTFAAVRAAMAKLTQKGSVDYRVTGQFTYVTPFGNITRPYSGTGRLDGLRF